MSTISPTPVNNTSSPNTNTVTTTVSKVNNTTPQKVDMKAPESASKIDALKEKEFGPVVSTSSDGDTLRVKNENEDLGSVTSEEDEQPKYIHYEIPDFELESSYSTSEITSTSVAEETSTSDLGSETEAEDIFSYAGYSDSQLKLMYLKGQISLQNFDEELSSRQARREATRLENRYLNDEIMEDFSSQKSLMNAEETIDRIQNGEMSDTLPLEERLKAIQNLEYHKSQ